VKPTSKKANVLGCAMIASKQVGDPEHLPVFAAADGTAKWFGKRP
jgi:hypothetical protein